MICDYCVYRNSWDCEDGWGRRSNCSEFKIDWNALSEEKRKEIYEKLKTCLIYDGDD